MRKKDYITADKEFEGCRDLYTESAGIRIISEATKILVAVADEKEKLKKVEKKIEETKNHGEKAIVCGQSEQETSG